MNGIFLDPNTYDVDIDVKLNSLGQIAGGLIVGNTMNQNEAVILIVHPGEIKEYPMLGVGIDDMVNDNDLNEWEHSIRVNLIRDNMDVNTVSINKKTGDINIDAEYK